MLQCRQYFILFIKPTSKPREVSEATPTPHSRPFRLANVKQPLSNAACFTRTLWARPRPLAAAGGTDSPGRETGPGEPAQGPLDPLPGPPQGTGWRWGTSSQTLPKPQTRVTGLGVDRVGCVVQQIQQNKYISV